MTNVADFYGLLDPSNEIRLLTDLIRKFLDIVVNYHVYQEPINYVIGDKYARQIVDK